MNPVREWEQVPGAAAAVTHEQRTDQSSQYPLHVAARLGQVDEVLHLLKCGTMVNEMDWDQVSPLHEACFHGQVDCARILIENSALVNVPNIDGATPLCEASSRGSEGCIQLLLSHGAQVNPPFSLSSPLHEAVLTGNAACIKLLVDAGARLDASDCHFGTPLHTAAYKENLQSARILLRAGASVNATHIHRSALHIAAASTTPSSVAVALTLLDYGANVYSRDNQGKTARDLTLANTLLHTRLHEYETNPRALLEICCNRIRHLLGRHRLPHIYCLRLPKSLAHYVDQPTSKA